MASKTKRNEKKNIEYFFPHSWTSNQPLTYLTMKFNKGTREKWFFFRHRHHNEWEFFFFFVVSFDGSSFIDYHIHSFIDSSIHKNGFWNDWIMIGTIWRDIPNSVLAEEVWGCWWFNYRLSSCRVVWVSQSVLIWWVNMTEVVDED